MESRSETGRPSATIGRIEGTAEVIGTADEQTISRLCRSRSLQSSGRTYHGCRFLTERREPAEGGYDAPASTDDGELYCMAAMHPTHVTCVLPAAAVAATTRCTALSLK